MKNTFFIRRNVLVSVSVNGRTTKFSTRTSSIPLKHKNHIDLLLLFNYQGMVIINTNMYTWQSCVLFYLKLGGYFDVSFQ